MTSGIREGLRGWNRRVRRSEGGSDEYLASLICEGGLPLRAIHSGRWLYQWLQGALDLAARGVDPDQAAAQEAWRVPATFRNHLEEGLRGDVTFVLLRDGFTVSRTTAAVAPSGFSTNAVSAPGRSLAITGLKGATATIDGTVKSDGPTDLVIVKRSGAAGNHFALDAVWPDGTCWRTELYDRTARPGFTDTSGAELPPDGVAALMPYLACTLPVPIGASSRLKSRRRHRNGASYA